MLVWVMGGVTQGCYGIWLFAVGTSRLPHLRHSKNRGKPMLHVTQFLAAIEAKTSETLTAIHGEYKEEGCFGTLPISTNNQTWNCHL